MGKRILLVEDQAETREALAKLLRRQGHEVFDFANADKAAEHLAATSAVDVAVLDVFLPGTPGDAFAHELLERFPGTRVMILTGVSPAYELRNVPPGVPVFRKPTEIQKLLDAVNADK